jgi:RHS repeat-associated protein
MIISICPKAILAQALNYQQLFTNGNFSKTIDQSKPIGAIAGNADVILSGGATYTLPIAMPVGTNGMVPSVSVQYNSQGGNGIAGWGWGITGTSAITRTQKSNFLDGEVKAVDFTNNDVFALDGNRLFANNGQYGANGTNYDKEEIDFATITSYGNVGSGPQYFIVKDRMGNKYEYGNTTDSRVMSDDQNHVMLWRMNRMQDVHGNYIDYVYTFYGRESLLKEINFTGNTTIGLLPYNKVSFEYAVGRVDQNTMYEGGYSLNSKSILQDITITGEGGIPFKKYSFLYAKDNLYSYLQEVKEYGADNYSSQLNSTIFKYGEQVAEFGKTDLNIDNINNLNEKDFISSLDLDGDGIKEILVNETSMNNGISQVANISLYKKNANGTYGYRGFYTPPNNQLAYEYNKNGKIDYAYVSGTNISTYSNADFNGDGKDDILSIHSTGTNNIQTLNTMGIVSFNTSAAPPYHFLTVKYDLALPTAHLFLDINVTKTYQCAGDFDGDGRTDFILITRKIVPESGNFVTRYRAYLYSASNNYGPKPIKNLILPGTTLPDVEYTNIVDPVANVDDEVNVINLDGDNKADLLVKLSGTSYVFSISKNQTGAYEASAKNVSSDLYGRTIFQGDFNGDGKTDVLSYDPISGNNPTWQIHISDGKKFSNSAFSFNLPWDPVMQQWIGQAIVPKDRLVVADVNGDGKSDIILGKSATIGSSCGSTVYYIHTYYSTGMGFIYKNYSINNNVMQCPGLGAVPFPQNDLLASDVNGDGKTDLLYKTTTAGFAVGKMAFKENGQENLLQKVIDGKDNKIEFRYEPLTVGAPLHEAGGIAPVTINNFDVNYPLTSVQLPLYVVSTVTKPDGIGGNQSTNYTYKEALTQLSGRGFLGFLSITATNTVNNTKAVANFMPKLDRSLLWLKNIENYQLNNNTLVSTMIFNNSFVSFGNKLFQQRNDDAISQNVLQGYAEKTTNQTFDIWGNVTQCKTELYKAANNNIEELLTNIMYVAPGTASAIPGVPSDIDITKTRAGQASVNTQKKFTYYNSGLLENAIEYANTQSPITTNYFYTPAGNISTATVSAIGILPRKKSFIYENKFRFATKTISTTFPIIPDITFEENILFEPLWGNVVSNLSSQCLNTTYSYDAFGRVLQSNHKVGTAEAYSVNYSRGWSINAQTQTFESLTHPGKPDIITYYDKIGRKKLQAIKGFNNQDVYSAISYDARGNVATETNTYLANETPIVTYYSYDDLNRQQSSSNVMATINYWYTFQNGDLKTITSNQNTGVNTSTVADPSGKVLYSVDDGGSLTFEYDSWGNEIKTSKGGQVFTEKVFDNFNRLTSISDANAGTKTYTYNGAGELIQEIDALGNTHNYVYDGIGRLKYKNGAEGTRTYIYGDGVDVCKRAYLTKIVNYNGVVEDMNYDNMGRLITHNKIIDNNNYLHKYTYDQYDNKITEDYPSAYKTYNEYNADGYLQKVGYATAFNGQGQPTAFHYFFTAQEVNGMGQAKKYLLGNGYTTNKSYLNGYLQSHKATFNGSSVFDIETSFDFANDNLLSRKDNLGIAAQTELFTYDNLDRLISSQISVPNNQFAAVTYQYDGVANSSKGNVAQNSIIGNLSGYAAPKYHAVRHVQGFVPVPGPAVVPDPSIISAIDQDIEYTSFNKTAHIVENNMDLQIEYDAQEDRVKNVLTDNNTNAITTKHYIGNYETKTTPLGETYKIHYIAGGDGLCAVVTIDDINGTQVHYTYSDHLGSIATITDGTGGIEAKQSFDAWGRRRDPDAWHNIYASTFTPAYIPTWLYRGYTGHEQVPDFALINMNGRMYDPALGRMCSPDKYIQAKYFTQAYNRYSYCMNNPLKYTDPSGNIFVGTVHTLFRDLVDKALFQGGLDPTSRNARQNAWRNFDPSASWSKTNKASRIDLGVFQTDNNRTTGGRILQLASRFTAENGQQFFGKMYAHARNVTGNVDNVDYWGGATVVNQNTTGFSWGVTLGSYINSQNMASNPSDRLFRHEYGHTLQSRLTGPLYLPIVGIPSLAGSGLWELGLHNHDDEWNEIQANRMSFSYFEKHDPDNLVSTPWDENVYPRTYVDDWYFRLTNPHAFLWWLRF